jgi:hypothetical protein
MALLASFAVRPFFGGAAVSSLYFSNSAVHFSYAPKKTICLMVGVRSFFGGELHSLAWNFLLAHLERGGVLHIG